MNGLDLFSGIGGISQALSPWVRTVAYCERDRYATAVLLSRMERGEIEQAPIWDDVTTLTAKHLPRIDFISGGFPCTNISMAGRGEGLDGKQSGLFFEILRLAGRIRPSFIFLENVPAITHRGGGRVIAELASIGYDARWLVISAAEVGARFYGARWFCLASSMREGLEGLHEKSRGKYMQPPKSFVSTHNWTPKPRVLGKHHGIPNANDRIKCLGNGVVPQQVEEAFRRLAGIK